MTGKTYGVATLETVKALGGLEFLRGIANGTQPQAPISELLGFHLTEIEEGHAVFEAVPEFRHYNPIGTIHGGFISNAARFGARLRRLFHLAKGETWTTLELKFNMVRPITKDTGPVRAEGRLVHRGRSVATAEGDLKDRAGKLYAHATTTCMIFPARA